MLDTYPHFPQLCIVQERHIRGEKRAKIGAGEVWPGWENRGLGAMGGVFGFGSSGIIRTTNGITNGFGGMGWQGYSGSMTMVMQRGTVL